MNILTQMIGFTGTLILLSSLHFQDTKQIFSFQLLGNFLYLIHFFMLGAVTGNLSVIICILYDLCLSMNNRFFQGKIIAVVIILLQVVFVVISWNGPASSLTAIANISFIIAGWTKKPFFVRCACLIIYSPMWMIYDFLAGSFSGVVCEIGMEISAVISMVKDRNASQKLKVAYGGPYYRSRL